MTFTTRLSAWVVILHLLAAAAPFISRHGVHAAPAPQATGSASVSIPDPSPTIANACAQVSPATASFLLQSPEATPSIPATLAHACLQSVPNKPDPAARLINSLKAFVNWQSTLAWLKDPPPSYMFPAVDIQGGLDNISATAVAGGFASEYDFQLSIVELISSAHDGHFAYRPDVFKAFIFRNSLVADLVSVSRDGLEVPKLYHYSDLTGNGTAVTTNATITLPRAITKINGQDAAAFVEATNLKYSNYQDPDSQWNSQFATYASPGALPIIAASLFFQTASITLTYDHGEERTQESVAAVRRTVDFAGVSTGEDFYTKFCDPVLAVDQLAENATTMTPTPTSTSSATSLVTAAAEPTIPGYPFPVVRDATSNITAGYFLNGTGYDDVAVLSVSAFSPADDVDAVTYLNDFQKTVETFLAACKTASKKRLVIDVTANGGGYVVAGYDLFAQLFPDTPQFQGHNLRLTSSMEDLARIANSIPDTLSANPTTDAQAEALFALQNSEVVSNLIPGSVFSPTGENLTTVDAILAPVTLHGDRFTAYQSTPLNDSSLDYNLTGVGSRSNPAPAVFLPQDVLLLTDGTCGSTCTLFAYLLVTQLNVSTVVVGGRPQTGVMQSIAGVEGAQVFPLTSISAAASAALALSPPDRVKEMNGSDLAVIAEGYALARGATPGNPGAVNGKNAFARSDAETPLQFLYHPGNCRFFYTAEMVRGPERVWERAVDATWRDPEKWCVEGSRVALDMMGRPDDPLFRQAGQVQAEGAQNSAAAKGRREGLGLGAVVVVVLVGLL